MADIADIAIEERAASLIFEIMLADLVVVTGGGGCDKRRDNNQIVKYSNNHLFRNIICFLIIHLSQHGIL